MEEANGKGSSQVDLPMKRFPMNCLGGGEMPPLSTKMLRNLLFSKKINQLLQSTMPALFDIGVTFLLKSAFKCKKF